jgi:hypothetical protein
MAVLTSSLTSGRTRWLPPAAAGVAVAAATTYTGVLDPNTSHAFPLCPLKAVSGLDCPACGSLRAVHSLCHLDIAGAADHNLLFVIAAPFLVAAWAYWMGTSLGLRMPQVTLPKHLGQVLIFVAIAFAVIRNLPIPGHAFLDSSIV